VSPRTKVMRPRLTPLGGPRIGRPAGRTFIMAVTILVLGTFLIYPMIILLALSFDSARDIILGPAHWSFSNWTNAWATPGLLESLWNSCLTWFLVTVIGLPIGIVIAWILARTDIPRSRGLEVFFWVAYIIPILASTLGWEMLLSPGWGFLNKAAEWLPFIHAPGPFNIYSIPGIVFTKLMAGGIAFNVVLLTPPFRNMSRVLEEAALVTGATNLRTMLRITLPLMISPIALVLALQVINIFGGFEVEYLIGSQFHFFVFSTLIYQLVTLNVIPQYASAIVLASVTMVVIALVVPLQRWVLRRRVYATVSSSFTPGRIALGRWRIPVFSGTIGVLFVLAGLPAITLAVGSFMTRVGFFNIPDIWTLQHWQEVFSNPSFGGALYTTLTLACTAAIAGPIIFSLIAYMIVRTQWRGRAVLDWMIWGSSAMPGVLLGLGLLLMFLTTPGLKTLFGTIWPLIIVMVLGGATTGTNLFKGVLVQLGSSMEEAARVSGGGWIRTYFRVVIPILMPSMVLVGLLNFVAAAGATASIILLASYNTTSLSILGLQLAAGGQVEDGGIVSLVIMALSLGVALPARLLATRIGLRHDMQARGGEGGRAMADTSGLGVAAEAAAGTGSDALAASRD
jgi:iron(III) transport system permease protein